MSVSQKMAPSMYSVLWYTRSRLPANSQVEFEAEKEMHAHL